MLIVLAPELPLALEPPLVLLLPLEPQAAIATADAATAAADVALRSLIFLLLLTPAGSL